MRVTQNMITTVTAGTDLSDVGFEMSGTGFPGSHGNSRRGGHMLEEGDPGDRLLSRAQSEALWARIKGMTAGGGEIQVSIRSSWYGYLKWARNRPVTTAVTMDRWVIVERMANGIRAQVATNRIDDSSLQSVVRRAEQQLSKQSKSPGKYIVKSPFSGPQSYVQSPIWREATARVTAQERSEAALKAVMPVLQAKALTAGYAATNVETWSIFNTTGLIAQAQATGALYGVNARDPENSGAGWAGRTHNDWGQLNITHLAARALEKCKASANPRAVEPGRYTAILEPEAVSMLIFHCMYRLDRMWAESDPSHAFGLQPGQSKIGLKVFDERLSISTDPMDPDAAYIPFNGQGYPYRAVKWVDRGILKELAYDREYAQRKLGTDLPLPNPLACRMSTHGPETSVEEMIATTERGLLVTRFGIGFSDSNQTIQIRATTRDGFWLVEKGKVRMPIKNMWVFESPLYAFNNVVQIGKPERVWGRQHEFGRSDEPAMAVNHSWVPFALPALKVRDFNFVALADAV